MPSSSSSPALATRRPIPTMVRLARNCQLGGEGFIDLVVLARHLEKLSEKELTRGLMEVANHGIEIGKLSDTEGKTLLHRLAIASAHWEAGIAQKSTWMVPKLVAAGCDVNAADSLGLRPVHAAGGSPQFLQALLLAGADPKAENRMGRNAAYGASPECLALLVPLGVDVCKGVNGDTPLKRACLLHQPELVRALLSYGAALPADIEQYAGEVGQILRATAHAKALQESLPSFSTPKPRL